MKRHRSRRNTSVSTLNLVALMDIFTILVFFLMVNSSDVQIKDVHESVKLPESTTVAMPEDTLKLYITKKYMFIDNDSQQISLESLAQDGTYPQLVERLNFYAQRQGEIPESMKETGRPITILGDRTTNYTTLQQILATCAETDFRDVSLAVIFEETQVSPSSSGSEQAMLKTNEATAVASLNASSLSR